jgi:two-component system NarL family sensor kinase
MAEVVAVADETMEQIRRLSHGLRPPALERFGLGSAVEGLCTELGERSPLQVTCEVAPMPSLPDDVAISLYRVLQEATTNIVRHAEAKSVHVALTREEDAIQLKIVDDGKGFSNEAAVRFENGGGIGLETMHERIELFDGTFTVDSVAGRGTTIIARVPYAPRA